MNDDGHLRVILWLLNFERGEHDTGNNSSIPGMVHFNSRVVAGIQHSLPHRLWELGGENPCQFIWAGECPSEAGLFSIPCVLQACHFRLLPRTLFGSNDNAVEKPLGG